VLLIDLRLHIMYHHYVHIFESTIHTRRGRSRARAWRRRPQYFEGAKVPNFDEKPPVFFLSEQSRMSTLSVQKFWAKKLLIISRNSEKHIWPWVPNSEVPEIQKTGWRSSVIMLDTPSQDLSWTSQGNRYSGIWALVEGHPDSSL